MSKSKRKMTPKAVREAAVARAQEIGIQAASVETGFSVFTLKTWRWRIFGATRAYRSSVDRGVAIRLADQVGVNEAARRLGVHACQISRWRRAVGLPAIGASAKKGRTAYSGSLITRALKRVDQIGLAATVEELGVPRSTLSRWRRDRRLAGGAA